MADDLDAPAAPAAGLNRDGLPIRAGEDVGLAAGMSRDGVTSVHDQGMPRWYADPGGQRLDLQESRDYHERVEKALLDAGHTYPEAHRAATEAEHARMRQLGFDPNAVEDFQQPHIDSAAHRARALGNTTRDVTGEPYQDSGENAMREDGGEPDPRYVLDRDGGRYTQPVHGKLLDRIETVTGRGEDGGHAVIDPHSGMVLARGGSREAAQARAQQTAAWLGRRRLQAQLDAEPPKSQQQLRERFEGPLEDAQRAVTLGATLPSRSGDDGSAPAPANNADTTRQGALADLIDQGWRLGSQWQTLHHNGTAFDKAAAAEQYQRLQERLSRAISDPDTPDHQRLPLGVAGYQLFTGANIAGIVPVAPIPKAAMYAWVGSMAYGGDSAATGPKAFPGKGVFRNPEAPDLRPTGGGNRTAITVPGGETGNPAARTPAFDGTPTGTGLSKPERLNIFNRQLMSAPPAQTTEEGLALVSSTMNNVEDTYSGVPAEQNPGLGYTGRMYPPRPDRIKRYDDGTLRAITAGNIIIIKPDGTISLYQKGPYDTIGKLILTKPGRGS